jgi:plasmid replication initiation protein
MKKSITGTVLTSKTPKVYKNRELNNASFGNFTLNDYQVFLHLLSKVGGVDEYGKYLQQEEIDREYTLTAKEFSEVFNTDLSGSYKLLRSACEKLQTSTIFLNQGALPEIWKINVCSMAKYNESEGYINIEFSDRIMPYITQVKQVTHGFVLYNLKEIASFGSIYATRLYELLQEYKHTGWVQRSVEQLRNVFAVGELLKEYKDFKKRTFMHACNEINNHYPEMRLKFEEIKEGRKVGTIKFSFRKTEVQQFIDPKTGKVSNIYTKPQRTVKPRKRGDGGVLPLFELLKDITALSNSPDNKD